MSAATASPPVTALPLAGAVTRHRAWGDERMIACVAAFYVAVALVGFIPSSVQKLAEVSAGQRAPFLPILHVHAAAMGAWLLLLATQAGLASAGRRAAHRALALGSLVLVPVMIVAGLLLVPATFHSVWNMIAAPPAGMEPAAVEHVRRLITNLPLLQYRAIAVFAVLFVWALMLRKSDPGTHQRLMVLATSTPLLAAVDRIGWLPTTVPDSPLSLEIAGVLLVLPMLIHDLVRHRRVPRAYAIWACVSLPFVIATHTLWGTPGWAALVPKLMGVAG